MTLRTHRVATTAFSRVEARLGLDDEERKKYGAIAHKLPGMVLQNGLAQSTGFLLAKGENRDGDHHSLLLDDLIAVLAASGAIKDGQCERLALHQRIIKADLGETLRLTRAVLEASGWMKRYVQGLLRIGATGESTAQADT
ncbi:type III-B CRISPR module-associated protein Cmr5 [Halorhodospira halochloris]|uniref:type III-B CRISPR module-associated protein Cmr5 n=1 Tax=Halorhodospira halochloris TaxID=1052 RepID=UPI001EE8F0E7|nr:type III-B CRISPR module-associated protein Cmr5 [Halorhodospira halochloris]MCG5531157.1 type III-B CRISPR module-associated protein Cmr5 [Halorhodospira halochloris]